MNFQLPGAYPWIAALGYFEENNRNALKFLCGGSLIHSRYVITSAHCINPMLTLVRLGAHDLSQPAESGAMDLRIRRTVVHEHFDLNSISNDIALIELNVVGALPGAQCLYINTINITLLKHFFLICKNR